jgi:hypothetical protein
VAGPRCMGRRGHAGHARDKRVVPFLDHARSGAAFWEKTEGAGNIPAGGGQRRDSGGVEASWGCPGAARRRPFPPAAALPGVSSSADVHGRTATAAFSGDLGGAEAGVRTRRRR